MFSFTHNKGHTSKNFAEIPFLASQNDTYPEYQKQMISMIRGTWRSRHSRILLMGIQGSTVLTEEIMAMSSKNTEIYF